MTSMTEENDQSIKEVEVMNYEILGKSITVKGNEGQERLMEKLSSR